jgi:hypothetical protein
MPDARLRVEKALQLRETEGVSWEIVRQRLGAGAVSRAQKILRKRRQALARR